MNNLDNTTEQTVNNPYGLSELELATLRESIAGFQFYFTDTRDGLQGGHSPSIEAIFKVVGLISHYITAVNGILEGGYAGATPNEQKKFNYINGSGITLSAFGSSKLSKSSLEDHFRHILESGSDIATIYVKCSSFQVNEVLKISEEQNLQIIRESISYLKQNDKKVIVDLEHFFDGYKENPEYVYRCIEAILDAGGETIVLCDTLGKTSPIEVAGIVNELCDESKYPNIAIKLKGKLGLHLHEDKHFTFESVIRALATGNVSHVQGNFGYTGERVGNTPLALLFVTLFEDYGIDIFEGHPQRELLWKNLLATYSQVSHLLTGKFPSKADGPLDIGNSYHYAGQHTGALAKHGDTYSIYSGKIMGLLGLSNYPGLTNQSGKANVSYYLQDSFPDIYLNKLIQDTLDLLKQDGALNYTESLASFLLQSYRLHSENGKGLQAMINEKFGIGKIITTMNTDDEGNHLGTTINVVTINGEIHDVKGTENENGIFNGFFKLLISKLKSNYDFVENLELISYNSESESHNPDSNVVTKLVFKEKEGDMVFSVISRNKNADIANINAIKEAFYYYFLCKTGRIQHVKSKILEVRYGNIDWKD